MLTFLTAVSLGKATEDDIDDWVERWHTNPELSDIPLHEYLGMTREEYYQWAKDPDAIRMLLKLPCRDCCLPYPEHDPICPART